MGTPGVGIGRPSIGGLPETYSPDQWRMSEPIPQTLIPVPTQPRPQVCPQPSVPNRYWLWTDEKHPKLYLTLDHYNRLNGHISEMAETLVSIQNTLVLLQQQIENHTHDETGAIDYNVLIGKLDSRYALKNTPIAIQIRDGEEVFTQERKLSEAGKEDNPFKLRVEGLLEASQGGSK